MIGWGVAVNHAALLVYNNILIWKAFSIGIMPIRIVYFDIKR